MVHFSGVDFFGPFSNKTFEVDHFYRLIVLLLCLWTSEIWYCEEVLHVEKYKILIQTYGVTFSQGISIRTFLLNITHCLCSEV
jgi:hypothetical protein